MSLEIYTSIVAMLNSLLRNFVQLKALPKAGIHAYIFKDRTSARLISVTCTEIVVAVLLRLYSVHYEIDPPPVMSLQQSLIEEMSRATEDADLHSNIQSNIWPLHAPLIECDLS